MSTLNLPLTQLFDIVKNDNSFLKPKLYIIQSNTFRLSSRQLPDYCAKGMDQLLSNGSTIVHADSYYGPLVGYKYSSWRFWKNKEIKAFLPFAMNVSNGVNYHCLNECKERIHTGTAARRFEFTGNEYIINGWKINKNTSTTTTLFNW